MKKLTLLVALLWGIASFTIKAQTAPPSIKVAVTKADVDALTKFVFKDKRYLSSPAYSKYDEETGEVEPVEDEVLQAMCKQFLHEHLIGKRQLDTYYQITAFGGHWVWAKPSNIIVVAMGYTDGFDWQSMTVLKERTMAEMDELQEIEILYDLASTTESYQLDHRKATNTSHFHKEKNDMYFSSMEVNYIPAEIVLKAEQKQDLYVDCEAEFEVTATDKENKYIYPFYLLNKVTPDTEYAELITPEEKIYTKEPNGKAKFRLKGIKEGKFILKIGFRYEVPNNIKRPIESYTTLEVEVKGPETYEYSISGRESITVPYDFTMSGSFDVVPTMNVQDSTVIWKINSSPVLFTGPNVNVTYETIAASLDSTDKKSNVTIAINPDDISQQPELFKEDAFQGLKNALDPLYYEQLMMKVLQGLPEPKVEVNYPMAIIIPTEDGTYSCKVDMTTEENMAREAFMKEKKLLVIPSTKSISRMFDMEVMMACAQNISEVILTATATVKKVEKKEE